MQIATCRPRVDDRDPAGRDADVVDAALQHAAVFQEEDAAASGCAHLLGGAGPRRAITLLQGLLVLPSVTEPKQEAAAARVDLSGATLPSDVRRSCS